MRHGEVPITVYDFIPEDDPDLANVYADMGTWMAAHPCPCEALCECDDER